DPPSGTGDAVRIALEHLGVPAGSVLVVAGDTPLIRVSTLNAMLEAHEAAGAGATLLTARLDDPTGYGRIIRGPGDSVERIVEHADAVPEERSLKEINTATYVFDIARLSTVIAKIDKENRQGEYYLTDAIGLLSASGDPLVAVEGDADESHGVNTRSHLARVRKLLHERVCERWLDAGVTIMDPSSTYIDVTVEIGADAVIHPFTFLEGATVIGERAEVGPQTRAIDSSIGPEANVSFAVIRESTIGPEASVGPFASLRAGTDVGKGSRVGTFVETKQTTIGEGSKANHLAYLGDAEIGTGVNIGAGTITCNWDGQEKHKTVIEDDAYIASDTMLVAPTHIGKRAATGAGAVVRGDVPDDALAVGIPARVIEGKGDKLKRKQGKMGSEQPDQGEEPTS
ncbi:MAG: bifunctional UDP-N-acetylglucosamine pyrophosphorylase / glucosamine-phosphate N-acetyltransferase, partial [Actinomycetota bacterium]|nr:bifunctional UDP-N-acetylglucosamine pyrophosphorylase / glucosamine-phosphate N-acetyltransferase [Actinomycetota bacterium]